MAGRRSSRRRGIVLDRTKLGEQDLILTLLTVEGEQLRVVAKGARKPGTRLCARTELFCDVDMLVSEGRGLGIVSEAQVADAHVSVRRDIDALSCASALCELARLTCYENVPDSLLHPLLTRALLACGQAKSRAQLDIVYAAYALKVLSHGGWRPVLEECVACGEPDVSRFSALAGGAMCSSCARAVEGALPVDANGVGWIRALVGLTFDALLDAAVDESTSAWLLSIANAWCATHLDVRLRATEFFAGL